MYNILYLKKNDFFFFLSFSGRTDIGLFNIEIPETCIGVLMTVNIVLFIFNYLFYYFNRSHH